MFVCTDLYKIFSFIKLNVSNIIVVMVWYIYIYKYIKIFIKQKMRIYVFYKLYDDKYW